MPRHRPTFLGSVEMAGRAQFGKNNMLSQAHISCYVVVRRVQNAGANSTDGDLHIILGSGH